MVQQIRLQTTEPLRINYYISGHGYGHATRSAKVVEALLLANPTTEVTVITTAPAHLFTSSNRLRLIAQVVDSAIIQPQPYTIDAEISLLNMEKFVRSTETVEYQTTATDLLKATSCNLIIADAPCPLAWNINKQIPSILISNFSFDAIFEELLQYLPPDNQLNVSSFVAKLRTVYANYGYVIRLPGFINFPFVDRHWTAEQKRDNVIDSPLVFRQARRSRSDVLSDLGIPKASHDQKKILLVQFGGQIVAGSSDLVPQLPKDWICLSASAPASDPRFVTFPADVYSPDLVETADVVLGKIGMFPIACRLHRQHRVKIPYICFSNTECIRSILIMNLERRPSAMHIVSVPLFI